MAEKNQNLFPFRFKALLIGIALAGLIGLSVLVIRRHTPCEGIFEQTAPKVEANLQIIKNTGRLAVSQEKIQELSESAQKVGLHLKTCCSVLERGKLNTEQFQECIEMATAYDKQIALVAQQVTEIAEAKEKGATDIVQSKIASVDTVIKSANSSVEDLARHVSELKPAKGNVTQEKEPNDQSTEANLINLGTRVQGSIAAKQDRDFFKFKTSDRVPSKTRVILRKLSPNGFNADVDVYDQVEEFVEGDSGSNDRPVSLAFRSTPSSFYYVLVKPYGIEWSPGVGPYELEVREE